MLTKNPDKPVTNPSWSAALRDFDEGLRRQQLAEKTRRAYGVDLGQLAEWAGAHSLAPEQLDFRALRRFAGVLSERGMSRSTVARKLASIRSFYAQQVRAGRLEASPADLVSSPKRDSHLPTVLKPAELTALLDSMPGSTALELRDRAMFELTYAAGLRAEEVVDLDLDSLDPDAEELRVEGKGGKTRVVPAGEAAWRALRAWLDRGRPQLERQADPAPRRSSRLGRLRTIHSSFPRPAAGCPPPTCAGGWPRLFGARPSRAGSRRTRCVTRSPPTCSRVEPICAASRSCSATRRSVRPRHTLG